MAGLGVLVVAVLVVAPSATSQTYSLDHDYSDYLYSQPVSSADTPHGSLPLWEQHDVKIYKCLCGGNQTWDGFGCVDELTYVVVVDPGTGDAQTVETAKFGGVTVGRVQCPPNHLPIKLEPRYNNMHQFSLLPNGTLYWDGVQYEHYCIDHTLYSEKQSWEALVCVPPPAVPRCCPAGIALTGNGSCSGDSKQRFSPPVMMDGVFLEWPEEVEGENVNVKCNDNENVKTLSLSNDALSSNEAFLMYESGAAPLYWPAAESSQLQREGFCVGTEMGGVDYVAVVCFEDQEITHHLLCENATCVRKCCPENETMEGVKCAPAKTEIDLWKPSFTDSSDLTTSVDAPGDLVFVYGRPQCSSYLLEPHNSKKDEFYILRNGYLLSTDLSESYPPTQYCVDNFRNYDGQTNTQAILCFPEEKVSPVCKTIKSQVYPALLLVSSLFLGVTLVLYISVPEVRDKLHGRCLISLMSALFVGYVLMATTNLALNTLSSTLCSFLASVMHLSLLAAFFWLNVMCFDIWRTLRKTRTVSDGGWPALRRFLLYSLYSWGCPLVLTLVAVVVEHLPPSYDVIRPDFQHKCWFQDNRSKWAYFYGWVLVLVAANLIFFGMVVVILVKGHNSPLLKRTREQNRERMWLYVKLFLVMGVSWVAEVLSWQIGECGGWVLTDVINSLQGLTLFLVFILNRTTQRKIRARWGTIRGQPRPSLGPTSTLTSSFSSTHYSDLRRGSDRYFPTHAKGSPHFPRSSAAAVNSGVCNTQSTIPMHALKAAPDDQAEPLQNGSRQEPLQSDSEQPTVGGKETTDEGGHAGETTNMTSRGDPEGGL